MRRFTIRELMIVAGTVAVAVGWLVDHNRMAHTSDRCRDESNALGALLARHGWTVDVGEHAVTIEKDGRTDSIRYDQLLQPSRSSAPWRTATESRR